MEKEITLNIGELNGKLLLFGGVYSNLQALEGLKEIAKNLNVPNKNIICTGDIVGYCAQPEESVQLIKEWGIHSIAGNVEIQLREEQEDCGCDFSEDSRCDIFSRKWYPYAQTKVSENSLMWMKNLPNFITFTYNTKKVVVVHGSLFETSEFIFKSTPWVVKEKNFNKAGADIIIGGHCGLPFKDVNQKKVWLNPGVIGMPANNSSTKVWYAIVEVIDSEIIIEHHSYSYNHNLASKLMENVELPASYAQTLKDGIWDNCDILPDSETNEQGKEIIIF
jgi:predicted phosphodiesterase